MPHARESKDQGLEATLEWAHRILAVAAGKQSTESMWMSQGDDERDGGASYTDVRNPAGADGG